MMNYLKQNRHLMLLLYLPVYLAAFFIIDRIPAEHYVIRCSLDRLIPFNEYMVIPYALWFFWFPGWVLWFAWRSLEDDGAREDFIKLCVVMFTGMTLCLITYVIWPNAVDLREPIEASNLCALAVEAIRAADTPYGVCPSIHISTIVTEALVIRDSRLPVLTPTVRVYSYVITALITWSTLAIRQHSIIDVAAGALLALLLYEGYRSFRSLKVK